MKPWQHAQQRVQEALKNLAQQHAQFDWQRVHDARSGRGAGVKAPGDFLFFLPRAHGVIEVKSVNHTFRVPAKNISQLPMLRRRRLAGGIGLVLVRFEPDRLWRCASLPWLWSRRDAPSYDMRELEVCQDSPKELEQFIWRNIHAGEKR